jgi:glyoxylase-like metal-dependent hydrolase (beta-lactamase superfamily II)
MNQWKIGAVTVTRIVELELPGLTFILPDMTPENLRPMEWLSPHFVNEEWQPIASVHALVVESQGKRIVVDTCIGNDKTLAIKPWCNRKGPFLEDFKGAGFDREAIDMVLCTHLHPDHVGWNTMLVDGRWKPTFPKADYLFGRLEWEHWNRSRDRHTAPLLEQSVEPVLDAGLERLVETDHRVTDEVWLEPTPGHTPGHVSVRIASKGAEAVITGDVLHHPGQMGRPHWKCTADVDSDAAVATRKAFLSRYSDAPILVIGTHFAAPTAGHVVRDGEAWRFEV